LGSAKLLLTWLGQAPPQHLRLNSCTATSAEPTDKAGTECVADSDFGSILTTFESSSIFGGSWGYIENWLKSKIKPPTGNLAYTCLVVKRSYNFWPTQNRAAWFF